MQDRKHEIIVPGEIIWSAQRYRDIRDDPVYSDWIKSALDSVLGRDPVDSVKDAEMLLSIVQERLNAIERFEARHNPPKTFTFHTDPGHGWLEVSLTDLADVGLSFRSDVSPYSYFNGNSIYLEEDCDTGTFVRAFKRKYGFEPAIAESYKESTPIREYAHVPQIPGGWQSPFV